MLAPLSTNDYAFAYELTMDQSARGRWRYFGLSPSPESFVSSLWADVSVQYCIWDRESAERIGICTAYKADFRNGTVWIAAAFVNDHPASSLEAVRLFIDSLFDSMPLRKIYCEVPEVVESDIKSSLRSVMHEEGRLTGHYFWKGRYWDWIYFAISKESWDNYKSKFERLRALLDT